MNKRVISLFYLFCLYINGAEKPWAIHGDFTYEDNRPLACELVCSMSLLQSYLNLQILDEGRYNKEMEGTVIPWILNERETLLEVRYSGQTLATIIKDIKIKNNKLEQLKDKETNYKLTEIMVFVKFLFPTPENVQNLDIIWKIFPDKLQKNNNVTPEEKAVAIYFNKNKKIYTSLNSNNPSFRWFNNSPPHIPEVPVQESIISSRYSQFNIAAKALMISILLTFFCWIIIDKPSLRKSSMILTFVIINSLPTFIDLRGSELKKQYRLPEGKDLEEVMCRLLINIYRGPTANNPNWMYHELSKASLGHFREKTFTKIYESKAKNPDTLQIVENLKIENCQLIGNKYVECQWAVKAHIMHRHHVHEKNLRFKAIFLLSSQKDQWLIKDGKIIPVINEEIKNDIS